MKNSGEKKGAPGGMLVVSYFAVKAAAAAGSGLGVEGAIVAVW